MCDTEGPKPTWGSEHREMMISYYLTTSMTLPEISFICLRDDQKKGPDYGACAVIGEKGGPTEEALFANKPVSYYPFMIRRQITMSKLCCDLPSKTSSPVLPSIVLFGSS
jgi:hypothetical protein